MIRVVAVSAVLALLAISCAHGVDESLLLEDNDDEEEQSTNGSSFTSNTSTTPPMQSTNSSGSTNDPVNEPPEMMDEPVDSDAGVPNDGMDDKPTTPTAEDIGFSVQYKVENTESPSPVIACELHIVNSGALTVSMSELSLRYFFTDENPSGSLIDINWAGINPGFRDFRGNLTPSVVKMTEQTDDANAYIEFTWTSGAPTIAPGDSADFSWQAHAPNFPTNIRQTNDYSFDASKTSLADWDRVALFRGETLIWGSIP